MCLKERSLASMVLLLLITFGLYFIYWSVKTKNEIKCMGTFIPTGLLIVIPFGNFYFWYKYSEAFVKHIKKDSDPVLYFILLAFVPIVGMFVVQSIINDFINSGRCKNCARP